MRNGVPHIFAVVMAKSCFMPSAPISAFQLGSTAARSPTLVSKFIIMNKFEVFKEMQFARSKHVLLECCIQQQEVW